MTRIPLFRKLVVTLVLGPIGSVVMTSQAAQGEEPVSYPMAQTIKVMKFSDHLKVRGLEISKGIYMGQAKVAGKYGPGLVFDRKDVVWGINHRGLSFTKRF